MTCRPESGWLSGYSPRRPRDLGTARGADSSPALVTPPPPGLAMFRVTPVPENSKERKVSFSPDIDESYRHQVVDKIKTLMDEVSVRVLENISS